MVCFPFGSNSATWGAKFELIFFCFCFAPSQKKAGLSCITQLRIWVKTLQPFFLGSKTHGASHSCCSIFVPVWSSNLKTDREVVHCGKEVPHLYGKGGWSSTKTTTCLWWLTENWGEGGGFYAHGTRNPAKLEDFASEEHRKNEFSNDSMQNQ